MSKCKLCNKEIIRTKKVKYNSDFCSYSCYEHFLKNTKTPNCKCANCGKLFYTKPNRIKKSKYGICCSSKCSNTFRKEWFKGENNHQYGLKGPKNATFKNMKKKTNYGYYSIYCPDHPFKDSGDRVKEHRLIVEANYTLFDMKYFCEINGRFYLKPDIEVHHINEIKTDNRIENLIPLTKSEHIKLHNSKKVIERDSSGRIISFKKKNQEII